MVRSDGTGLRELPRITSYDTEPAWSPDGRFLALSGVRYADRPAFDRIYTVRADGSQARGITSGTQDGDDQPTWSLEGKIAFTRGLPGTSDLYVTNPDGSALRLLARRGRYPDWSPRGQYLAFTGPGNYVYIVRSDGSGIRRLIRGGQPAWSPDGRWIAFTRYPDLYVVRTDGSGLRRIANGYANSAKAVLYVEPSWQPRR